MATSAISSVESATIAMVKIRSFVYSSRDLSKCASVKPPPGARKAPTAESSSGTTKKTPTTRSAGATSAIAAQRPRPPGGADTMAPSANVAIVTRSLQDDALIALDDVGEVLRQREWPAILR